MVGKDIYVYRVFTGRLGGILVEIYGENWGFLRGERFFWFSWKNERFLIKTEISMEKSGFSGIVD